MKRRPKQNAKEEGVEVAAAKVATVCPPFDAVSRRAREMWLARGQPQGCDEEIWLTAEREIAAEMSRGLPPLEDRGIEVPAEEVEKLRPRVDETIRHHSAPDRRPSPTSIQP